MTPTPEDQGRSAIRRFLADAAQRPKKRLSGPPLPEPEPQSVHHPDWFGPAWREGLEASADPTPDPDSTP